MNADREGREAMLANAIVGDAMREAAYWQFKRDHGADYAPPMFAMPGVELPIVPRIALPRIEGAARRFDRR